MPVASVMSPMHMIDRAFPIFRVVALVDAEYAFDATNHAADGSADDRADRTGDAIALVKAMNGTAGNSLSLRGERHGDRCKTCGAKQVFHFHRLIPFG